MNISQPNIPLNIKFLNVIQALESCHSRLICKHKMKNYKKRIDSLISRFPANQTDIEELLYYKEQRETDYVLLKTALNDLMLADYEVYFDTGTYNRFEFVEKVVQTRHYFTHYTESKISKIFNDEELNQAYQILMYILEFYLLRALNLSTEKINERFSRLHNWNSYYKLADKRWNNDGNF